MSHITKDSVIDALNNGTLKVLDPFNGDNMSISVLMKGVLNGIPVMGKAVGIPINTADTSERCLQNQRDIYAVMYERVIYEKVVTKTYDMSPNFVKMIGSVSLSKGDNMLLDEYWKSLSDCDVTTYSIFFTEYIEGYTLSSFIRNSFYGVKRYLPSVIAQLLLSIAVMQLIGINHNDLHTSNILIEDLLIPQPFTYNLAPGITFKIPKVRYKVYIFDWDLSYSRDFGNNPKLTEETCKDKAMCNTINPVYDIFMMLCNITLELEGSNDKYINFMESITNKTEDEIGLFIKTVRKYGIACRVPTIFNDSKLSQWRKKYHRYKYVFEGDKQHLKMIPRGAIQNSCGTVNDVGAEYDNVVDRFIEFLKDPYLKDVIEIIET